MAVSSSSAAGRGSRLAPVLPPATLAGFAVALFAVLVIAVFTYRAFTTRTESVNRITHTLDTIQQLEDLLSSLKDAETGQRGYLLTGDIRYLEPFDSGRATLVASFPTLRQQLAGDTAQLRRLDTLQTLADERLAIIDETLTLRRDGNAQGALDVVVSERGKLVMDRARALTAEMIATQRTALEVYQLARKNAVDATSRVTWIGSLVLFVLISIAAGTTSRQYRGRETELWIQSGQGDLAQRLQGEQRLDVLGDKVLAFLAQYLQAHVGAFYLRDTTGTFRRFAAYAVQPGPDTETVRPGDGLLGQAIKDNRPLRITDVPDGYLTAASTLGRGTPTELLIAPATVDGVVQAVVELGFFHRLIPADLEFLARVSESVGAAIRSAKDRTRLEELLEETQRQAEELQAQQEELRVSNEELEEQTRALRESQARLETQQVELEQTNTQLEEQSSLLEAQKDSLGRSQADLQAKAAELERANKYKSEFLANMSHELRTPLNSALILSKLLADNRTGNLTPEQVKFAQTIGSAGRDLLALINDILDLSKIEAGRLEVHPEPVALAQLLDSMTKTFKPTAEDKHLSFEVVADRSAPEAIETDAQRIGQILKNLLSNAVKFTDAGSVTLRVYAPAPGSVSFEVRDTGVGIPQEQLGVIFEAFRQADGSTHRRYGGTGLGLSISRDLARLLGGDVRVTSQPDQGSTFTLTLPTVYTGAREGTRATPPTAAAPSPAEAHRPRAVAPRPSADASRPSPPPARRLVDDDRDQLTPSSRSLLVIEDDTRFAAILRDLAREHGFQCIVTHSANEGVAAALQFHPSAILLDINLPDHSGLGVLDLLKRNPATRHIPVHIASVADFAQDALERGAVGYMLKPVQREDLVRAFRQLEAKVAQTLRRVLVVEDDARQRESIQQLLANDDVQIVGVRAAGEALEHLRQTTFDCMVMDLNLPDMSGYQLLETMAGQDGVSFPPVIVYTGRSLSADEEQQLRRYSRSIIVKDARSPERLLDEVTLFLHQVESSLPVERQRMLQAARERDTMLEGRRILIVEDDARNIFALSSVLEPKGVSIEVARNGREALEALAARMERGTLTIDLVLMDIMMPEMDGLTAMREIRRRPEWKKLPIIALTAKAMKDDQENCLSAGANDYIAKPLDVDKLLSLVRVWMPK